jgi:hypothetical protein
LHCIDIDDQGTIKKDAKEIKLGKTLPIFEYSKKKMVTDKDYWKTFWDVVRAPKSEKAK